MQIFGEKKDFPSPKPVELIKVILSLATESNDIVLDSFAGTGTTAQAVLELNEEDDGNRQFILVEMEEYAESLTAERVRRVIRGIPSTKDEALRNGFDKSFSFLSWAIQ